jgi:hypothetical protein
MSGREFFASEGPDAGDDISATPQIDDEQIFGSAFNEPGSAASIESAADIQFGQAIEDELLERARKIQTVDNDPDIPDRFEDDVYRSEKRAFDALKAVFRRGTGAYSRSAAPGVSRAQWAFGRTADFADIVKFGEPDDPDFTQDNDLLPDGHPLAIRDGETPFVEGLPTEAEQREIDRFMEDL